MKPEIEIDRTTDDEIWREVSYINKKRCGVTKIWGTNNNILWFDMYRHGIVMMEIYLPVSHKNVPTNKTLFNKHQWKQLCQKR